MFILICQKHFWGWTGTRTGTKKLWRNRISCTCLWNRYQYRYRYRYRNSGRGKTGKRFIPWTDFRDKYFPVFIKWKWFYTNSLVSFFANESLKVFFGLIFVCFLGGVCKDRVKSLFPRCFFEKGKVLELMFLPLFSDNLRITSTSWSWWWSWWWPWWWLWWW